MSSFSVVQEYRQRGERAAAKPLRPNPSLALALGAGAALAGLVLLGPLASRGFADDAGAMAFLLGEGTRHAPPSARPVPAIAPSVLRLASSPPHSAPASAHATRVAAAHRVARVARAETPLLDAIKRPPTATLTFASKDNLPLDDQTLRRGDAVMTRGGLRIFRGSHRYPYATADFLSLGSTRQIAHRDDLRAIDQIARRPDWSTSFTSISPVLTILRKPDAGVAAVTVVEVFRRS